MTEVSRSYHVQPDWHRTRSDDWSILVPFLGEPDAIWFDQFDGRVAFEEARPSVFHHARIAVARDEPAWTLNEMAGTAAPVLPPRSEPVLVLYGVSGDVVPDRLQDLVNRLVSEVNRLVNDGGVDFDVAAELKEGRLDLARVADKLKGDGRRFNEARYLRRW